MEIKETKKENVMILEMGWKLDVNTSPILEKRVLSLIEKGEKNIIFDFVNINYISSSGLRVILLAEKKAQELGGKVVLSNVQDHVKTIFDIAGFTSMLTLYPNNDEALKSFS